MAIEYRFLERDAETLITMSELPVEEGRAVAVRTTGYEVGVDEVVQISIVDFQGNELFAQTVKPQNIDEWTNVEASGGILPADVADAPELYQFEDEIIALFADASVVVGQHMGFMHEIIESSWVSLPDCREFDLTQEFCASHCTADYPEQSAAVAALPGIAAYYGAPCDEETCTGIARSVAACYVKLVEEHAQARLDKGQEFWEEYERRQEEVRKEDAQALEADRRKELRALQVNAFLWLCAAAIFSNLAVQLYIRGTDFGFVAIVVAAAIFFLVRWVMSLSALYRQRRNR